MSNRLLYALHRWVALVAAVQLLAWSAGGFVFAVLPIDDVRGKTDATERQIAPLALREVTVPLNQALAPLIDGGAKVTRVELRARRARVVWEVYTEGKKVPLGLIDAQTGAPLPLVNEAEARQIARADFKHEARVVEATRLAADALPLEARGRKGPLWRVVLDHEREPRLYISAVTGEVVARRNDLWRWFDFFWMLHVMDYDEREDFNHPLLIAFSLLAIFTALTGLVLWARRFLRRRGWLPRSGGTSRDATASRSAG
jgi:uncharacterized iron-regulated membrane protein